MASGTNREKPRPRNTAATRAAVGRLAATAAAVPSTPMATQAKKPRVMSRQRSVPLIVVHHAIVATSGGRQPPPVSPMFALRRLGEGEEGQATRSSLT